MAIITWPSRLGNNKTVAFEGLVLEKPPIESLPLPNTFQRVYYAVVWDVGTGKPQQVQCTGSNGVITVDATLEVTRAHEAWLSLSKAKESLQRTESAAGIQYDAAYSVWYNSSRRNTSPFEFTLSKELTASLMNDFAHQAAAQKNYDNAANVVRSLFSTKGVS